MSYKFKKFKKILKKLKNILKKADILRKTS